MLYIFKKFSTTTVFLLPWHAIRYFLCYTYPISIWNVGYSTQEGLLSSLLNYLILKLKQSEDRVCNPAVYHPGKRILFDSPQCKPCIGFKQTLQLKQVTSANPPLLNSQLCTKTKAPKQKPNVETRNWSKHSKKGFLSLANFRDALFNQKSSALPVAYGGEIPQSDSQTLRLIDWMGGFSEKSLVQCKRWKIWNLSEWGF